MIKIYQSPGYNYIFNRDDGFFARWGVTKDEDPDCSPVGPELLDIEVSEICHRSCKWCYKSNTSKGRNMSLSTFKVILDKMPNTLTQVAFGIGDIGSNKDLYSMMKYCREKSIVPNLTINGDRMRVSDYKQLSELAGAVAVSCYDFNICFNTVEKLASRGMKQVNIHQLLSEETWDKCMQVLEVTKSDARLEKLNAVVFLALKPKGRGESLHKVSQEHFQLLVDKALAMGVRFGFDSCTAPNFLAAVKGHPNYKQFEMVSEPCESSCFSAYISVDGMYYPCSFAEGVVSGIDVLAAKDFVKDVWMHPTTVAFREQLIANKDRNGCRECQIYNMRLEE